MEKGQTLFRIRNPTICPAYRDMSASGKERVPICPWAARFAESADVKRGDLPVSRGYACTPPPTRTYIPVRQAFRGVGCGRMRVPASGILRLRLRMTLIMRIDLAEELCENGPGPSGDPQNDRLPCA